MSDGKSRKTNDRVLRSICIHIMSIHVKLLVFLHCQNGSFDIKVESFSRKDASEFSVSMSPYCNRVGDAE